MFEALNEEGKEIPAIQSLKGVKYRCPDCKEEVKPRQGQINQWHYYHSDEHSSCPYGNGTGEGERHKAMKSWVLKFADNIGATAHDEVTNVSGGNKHRADVMLEFPGGKKFVVECQVSPISEPAWRRRTEDYSKAGYAVLWLWDHNMVNMNGLPESVWVCHEETRGRFYSLDNNGILVTNHIWWGNQDNEKYIKFIDRDELGQRKNIFFIRNPNGLWMANFQEGDFWLRIEKEREQAKEHINKIALQKKTARLLQEEEARQKEIEKIKSSIQQSKYITQFQQTVGAIGWESLSKEKQEMLLSFAENPNRASFAFKVAVTLVWRSQQTGWTQVFKEHFPDKWEKLSHEEQRIIIKEFGIAFLKGDRVRLGNLWWRLYRKFGILLGAEGKSLSQMVGESAETSYWYLASGQNRPYTKTFDRLSGVLPMPKPRNP